MTSVRRRPAPHRLTLALLAACLTLVAAACGRAPVPTGTGSVGRLHITSASAEKFAQCMRAHGLPQFPDPIPASAQGPSGQGGGAKIGITLGNVKFVLSGITPRSPLFQAAMRSCHSLLGIPLPGSTTLTAQQRQAIVAGAACMRSHGFPSFPDPGFGAPPPPPSSASGQGHFSVVGIPGAYFSLGGTGINPQSPTFQSEFRTCMAPGLPQPNSGGGK